MDHALALLLQLLELAAPPADAAATVRLEIDAPAILGEIAPPAALAAFILLLAEAAQGRVQAEEVLPRLQELASSIAAGQQAERIALLAGRLQSVAALAQARPAGTLAAASLDVGTSPLGELVTSWQLPESDDAPPITLVNLGGISRADRLVRAPGKHYVARRVRLRYRTDQPGPLVELDALSATLHNPLPQPHDSWHQSPHSDDDLRIFTEQERLIGHVRTRLVEPPVALQGGALELLLPAPAGARLLATELLDEREQPLLRVLCWPARSLAAGA